MNYARTVGTSSVHHKQVYNINYIKQKTIRLFSGIPTGRTGILLPPGCKLYRLSYPVPTSSFLLQI